MRRPDEVYVRLSAMAALAGTLAFTITNIYRFTVAGLTPFQLVVVGSAMEAAVFVSEIPTGVVADLYSRRWSVIIGHAGIGASFVAEASLPSFGGILFAQILWGVAYTFTSGATEAWLAGEMGEPTEGALRRVLFRSSRWSTVVSVVALPTSFILGAVSLRLPIAIAAGVQFALVGYLLVAMTEDHFERAALDERSDWQRFRATTGEGLRALRRSRTLRLLAVVIVVAGGSSEAYDRYGERHLLRDVGVPTVAGHGPLVTLSIVFTSSSLCGVFIAWWMEHHVDRRGPGIRKWLVWLITVQAVALIVFALTGSFLVAALSVIVIDRVRRVRQNLFASWIIPLTPKANRATVLSVFSQCDAVGQVTVGLGMGVIGGLWSVPAALVASAMVLAPTAAVVAAARRSDERPLPEPSTSALP
jgi:DHA3 family tetracycline resistance protein-like MFS transporter